VWCGGGVEVNMSCVGSGGSNLLWIYIKKKMNGIKVSIIPLCPEPRSWLDGLAIFINVCIIFLNTINDYIV
jgi:hypothetical protein